MWLQIGKAEKLVSKWGVTRRQLSHWAEEGLVKARYARHLSGRGKMRLFRDTSLIDAYLVCQLTKELAPERVRSALEEARQFYAQWLKQRPEHVTFEIQSKAAPVERYVTVAFPLRPAIDMIWLVFRQLDESASAIQRGRPSHDWRREFEANLAEVGRALGGEALSQQAIREEIAAYRKQRSQRPPQDFRVTVSA